MKNPVVEEIKRFLASTPPFNMLNSRDLYNLAKSVKISYYPRRSMIFSSEMKRPLDKLFVILKGSVSLTDPKTMEVVELLTQGDIFGVTSFLMRTPPFLNAEAVEDTILYEIPRDVFEPILKENNEIYRFLIGALRSRAAKTATVRTEKPWYYPLAHTKIRDIVLKKPVTCSIKSTLREAIEKMYQEGVSSIVIVKDDHPLGIITDTDIKRIVALDLNLNRRVDSFMSSPVWTVDYEASCLDAYMQMLKHNIKHLVVLEKGRIKGVITMRDIMLQEFYNPYYMIRDIEKMSTLEDLARTRGRLEGLAQQLLNRALEFHHISNLITLITDKLINKVISMAKEEVGYTSNDFSFMGFGSLGRKELTIESDIDSGIVFEDGIGEKGRSKILELGKCIMKMLKEIGYLGCEGGFSVDNPKWCKSVSEWLEFFQELTTSPSDKNILLLNILLDFRNVYGREDYVRKLRREVISLTKERPVFVWLLAKDLFKTEIRISPSSIKSKEVKNLLKPIFTGVRLLSLAEGIEETNTLKRISKLHEKGVLSREDKDTIISSYDFLSRLRLKLQLEEIRGEEFKEEIEEKLTRILMRESVKSIKRLQAVIEGYLASKYGVTKEWLLSYG